MTPNIQHYNGYSVGQPVWITGMPDGEIAGTITGLTANRVQVEVRQADYAGQGDWSYVTAYLPYSQIKPREN
jgi:hypothetical protein